MTTYSKITDWHRAFGLAIEGDFADYPFEVDREKDMSIQEVNYSDEWKTTQEVSIWKNRVSPSAKYCSN